MPAYFGLDIGSTSIKIFHLDGKNVRGVAIANNAMGKGLMEMNNSERIGVVETIKQLYKESGVRSRQVVCCIPESVTFSRVLKLPIMSTPELATAIKWELDQTVPFPPNEAEISWVLLEKPEKVTGQEKLSVFVVAVPSKVSELYTNLLELAGLEPLRLENQVPPLSRVFSSISSDDTPSVVVEMGASGTNMVLAGNTKLYGNYFLPYGGNALTRFIADTFSLPVVQAENYKRTYGMDKSQLEGKMYEVLRPIIDNLVGEIKKMMITFQNENKGKSVGRIVVCGGGSYLRGLIPYLTLQISNVEIVIGDSFSGLNIPEKFKGLGPVFAVSAGLSI